MSSSSGKPGDQQAKLEINVYVKVVEAKEVKSGDFDSFSLVKFEGREVFRTRTIFNSTNPLWDEEYLANLHEPLKDIEIVLWEVRGRMFPDQPLGKVFIGRDTIQSDAGVLQERWFPLLPADTEGSVSGDLKLELFLTEKSLKITLVNGQGLVAADVNGFSDPYVVFHLLPNAPQTPEQRSKIKKKTLNPKFDETFEFSFDKLTPDHELLVTVWDWDRFTEDDFLGHFVIQLSDLPLGKKFTDIFALRPKPTQLSLLMRKASVVNVQEEDPGKSTSSKPAAFAAAFEQLPREPDTPQTSLGSVRVKFKYSADIILAESHYAELMEVVAAENYLLPVVLGRVSNEREDAAWALVKYFQHYGEATHFLSAIIEHEVETTLDANTIFRGNSMSSKALDVYMKLTSLGYLSNTIGEHIKDVINSKKSLEVDPTRLDPKTDDIKKNWKNAKATVSAVLDSIFKSKDKVPSGLSVVFANLRQSVMKKWPQDDAVPYTSVAGFIFLRLFVAAILSPNLFGLWDEIPDQKSGRNLTIVAKTVQNVANLVSFGQKEAYLEDMNEVIKARIPEMKKFIEDISVKKEEPKKSKGTISKFLTKRKESKMGEKTVPSKFLKTFVERDVPKECARIYQHFSKSCDKIIEEIKKENLKTNLGETLVKQLEILSIAHEKGGKGAAAPQRPSSVALDGIFAPPQPPPSSAPAPPPPASPGPPPPPAPLPAGNATPAPPPLPPVITQTKAPAAPGAVPSPPPPPSPHSLAPVPSSPFGSKPHMSDGNPRFIRSFTSESMASLDNLKVDFTPVDVNKMTEDFDPKYSFDYFDRNATGSIPIKDFHLILNAQGVLPGAAEVQAAFKKAKISQNPNDLIDYATYQSVLSSLHLGPPKKESTAEAIRFVTEFFGKDPSKGIISLEQMNKMMAMGEGKLTTAQLNHIATLSATSGAERGGQVNLSALASLS